MAKGTHDQKRDDLLYKLYIKHKHVEKLTPVTV